jgi:hypothetical protein
MRDAQGNVVPACEGCGPAERVIPPLSTVSVVLLAKPYTFLFPGAPSAILGFGTTNPVSHVTGWVSDPWVTCINLDRTGTRCISQQEFRTVEFITRIGVHPRSSVTIESRPDSGDAAFAPATGEKTTAFSYADFDWVTAESGFTPF